MLRKALQKIFKFYKKAASFRILTEKDIYAEYGQQDSIFILLRGGANYLFGADIHNGLNKERVVTANPL